jgi:hypothetical protein
VGGGAYYYFVYRRAHAVPPEVMYVLPASADVMNTPAEVRVTVATLRHGDRVEVRGHSEGWVNVRLGDGRAGWLEADDLLDSATYEKGERILTGLRGEQPQAAGHTAYAANLRVEPARDAPLLGQIPAREGLEVFDRRLVERPPQPGSPPEREPVLEAWYLIRADSKAGWMYGRLVSLDVPPAISAYAQSYNLVAWLVLDTVDDNGRQVPQYVVADRVGTQELDFNHIRVFTWWAARQQYVTSYVESRLDGYFPIRVERVEGIPCFRLRLVDKNGRKFQKVYGLYDTIVRPLGTVEGWESDAMPARSASRTRHARSPTRQP